jgi:hypothetical protein
VVASEPADRTIALWGKSPVCCGYDKKHGLSGSVDEAPSRSKHFSAPSFLCRQRVLTARHITTSTTDLMYIYQLFLCGVLDYTPQESLIVRVRLVESARWSYSTLLPSAELQLLRRPVLSSSSPSSASSSSPSSSSPPASSSCSPSQSASLALDRRAPPGMRRRLIVSESVCARLSAPCCRRATGVLKPLFLSGLEYSTGILSALCTSK